jgi:truncated hemoglobin YjbI
MMANLRDARSRLDRRVEKKEITPEKRDEVMAAMTLSYVEIISPEEATDSNAWVVGDLYRDAGRWKEAFALYDRARKAAANEDRRVNDELRYARAAAVLGKMKDALAAAKATFSAPPKEKAPILPAILYEVVPAGQGKGSDLELARLLEGAIAQHQKVVVDPKSEPGQVFLIARPSHIQRAFSKMIELYDKAGRKDLARDAVARSEQIMRGYGSV